MTVQLDNDIWFLVIGILQARTIHGTNLDRKGAKAALLALRLTNRFLAVATAPHLLWLIKINRIDAESSARLQTLLQSPTSCFSVKKYELRAKIITSRQGDLNSPYHKIPPHLDYGRQSSSPAIQRENKQLKEAAKHWGQQYRIIFPTHNKAAAALKGAFKWSSTNSKTDLKNSIYLRALDAFVNLRHLVVQYPTPKSEKLNRIVSTEYSLALGRFLATNPSELSILQLESLRPKDLVILEQSITDTSKHGSQELLLKIKCLDITLDKIVEPTDELLHVFPEAGSSLMKLLQHTSQLSRLTICYSIEDLNRTRINNPNFLLSPFKPPPLSKLEKIVLRGLAFSPEDLLALVVSAPSRLTELEIGAVSLTGPSWAQILRTFATSETLEYFLQPLNVANLSYYDIPAGKSKRRETEEDRRAQLEWQALVEARVSKSVDGQDSDFSDV